MKAKRRHELKENVLAQELGQIKSFFSKHGGLLAGAALALGLLVLIVWNVRARGRQARNVERTQYAQLLKLVDLKMEDRLAEFVRLAENAKDSLIAADSAMRAANICSQQYLHTLNDPSAATEREESRHKAMKYYRMVIEQHADKKPVVANAYYGLGILAENSGDKEAALDSYKRALEIGGPNHLAAGDLKQRRARLEDWFAQEQFPATRPAATQPATATTPPMPPASAPASAPPAPAPAAATAPASMPAAGE